MNLIKLSATNLVGDIATIEDIAEYNIKRNSLTEALFRARATGKSSIFTLIRALSTASRTSIVGTEKEIAYIKGRLTILGVNVSGLSFNSCINVPKDVLDQERTTVYATTNAVNYLIKHSHPCVLRLQNKFKISNQYGKPSRKKYK